LGLCIGLPTADSTWAAEIPLSLNPKLQQCKSLLQRGQGKAVYVGIQCLCSNSCKGNSDHGLPKKYFIQEKVPLMLKVHIH